MRFFTSFATPLASGCQKHIQRKNFIIGKRPPPLCPVARSPPTTRISYLFLIKQVHMAPPCYVDRISYLHRNSTCLWVLENHTKRANSTREIRPLGFCRSVCPPPSTSTPHSVHHSHQNSPNFFKTLFLTSSTTSYAFGCITKIPTDKIYHRPKATLPLCPVACSPPKIRISCPIPIKQVHVAIAYLVDDTAHRHHNSTCLWIPKTTTGGRILYNKRWEWSRWGSGA